MCLGSFKKFDFFLRNEVWKYHLKAGRLSDATFSLSYSEGPSIPYHSVSCHVKSKGAGVQGKKVRPGVPLIFQKKKWKANSKRKHTACVRAFLRNLQKFIKVCWLCHWGAFRTWRWSVSALALNLVRAKGFVFSLLLLMSISFSAWLLFCRLHALSDRRSCLLERFFLIIIVVILITHSCQL